MKSLIKFAVGAAIAGALVNLWMKRREMSLTEDRAFDDAVGLGDEEPVVLEVVEITSDDGGREDWYGAQAGDSPAH